MAPSITVGKKLYIKQYGYSKMQICQQIAPKHLRINVSYACAHVRVPEMQVSSCLDK